MKFTAEEIAKELQALLDRKGFKSTDLAKAIGRGGQGSIDKTRKAQQSPRLDIFLNWLDALNVRPSDFFRILEKSEHGSGLDLEPGYDELYEMLASCSTSHPLWLRYFVSINRWCPSSSSTCFSAGRWWAGSSLWHGPAAPQKNRLLCRRR